MLRYLVTLGHSDPEYDGHVRVEHNSARLVMALLGSVKIVGEQYLPQPSLRDSTAPSLTTTLPAPVFIANHSSQIDVGAVYSFNRRFKWIAKSSVKYLPGVGQIMVLGGHVLIDRQTGKNRNSVSKLYEKSNKAVQGGISMFFFPQGTRRMVGRLPFKDGAFNVALQNKSTLIPVSVDVPANMWNDAYPLSLLWGGTVPSVTLTVHPPIPLTGTEDKDALKEQCATIIYSVLPKYGEDENGDQTKKTK
jgi:1-acyl-sn-glycerol-3-phosphate acyltransferase